MKRFYSILLVVVLFLAVLPVQAFAADMPQQGDDVIYYSDGSSLVISQAKEADQGAFLQSNSALASGTKSGQRTYTFRDSDGNVCWVATLTANYTYNGTSASCTSASCSVTISDHHFYVVSKNTTRSGNTATTHLTLGRRLLGVTVSKTNYTITLSCTKDGVLY